VSRGSGAHHEGGADRDLDPGQQPRVREAGQGLLVHNGCDVGRRSWREGENIFSFVQRAQESVAQSSHTAGWRDERGPR